MEHLSRDIAAARDKASPASPGSAVERSPEDTLAARIAGAIERQTTGRVQSLRVEVNGDGVMISGRCQSFYMKQLAQHAAMQVAGAEVLTNRIEVE
jgi:osmotically-inducible protein OsmY